MDKRSALVDWVRPLAGSGPKIADPADLSPRAEQVAHVERFRIDSERDWQHLIRDITALANSGGGRIRVPTLLDDTEVVRRLQQSTGSSFDSIELQAAEDPQGLAVMIAVGPAAFPLAFSPSSDASGAAERSPIPGGVYFWRGERSEPGTTADMREHVERLLRRMRRRWLRRIRRALAEPVTSQGVRPKRAAGQRVRLERPYLQPVRIVTDPSAPALQPQDVERLYPWRQKDLLRELNARLGRRALNSYDIQAVRRQHNLDQRPDFVFNLPGAGRRYSPAVAEWIMQQLSRDPEFFQHARAADQQTMRLRRQKPR